MYRLQHWLKSSNAGQRNHLVFPWGRGRGGGHFGKCLKRGLDERGKVFHVGFWLRVVAFELFGRIFENGGFDHHGTDSEVGDHRFPPLRHVLLAHAKDATRAVAFATGLGVERCHSEDCGRFEHVGRGKAFGFGCRDNGIWFGRGEYLASRYGIAGRLIRIDDF